LENLKPIRTIKNITETLKKEIIIKIIFSWVLFLL